MTPCDDDTPPQVATSDERTSHRKNPAMHRGRALTIHPFVFTAYAILALAAANIREIPVQQAVRSFSLAIVAAAFLVLLLRVVFRDWHRAGAMATVLLLLFYTYGHVYALLERVVLAGVVLGRHHYLLPISGLAAILIGVWLMRRQEPPVQTTRVLNFLSLVLLAFPVVTIGRTWLVLSREEGVNPLTLAPRGTLTPRSDIPMPDIYYIILDGYARSDFMREGFGYDNSDFIRYLESEGFYVAQDSYTNYFRTAYSLASSLNMEYVQNLGVSLERSSYPTPFIGPIRDGAVRLRLEELGYATVAMRSGYAATEWIDADTYLSPDPVDLEELAERPSLNAFEGLLVYTSGATVLRDLGLEIVSRSGGIPRPDYPFELLRLIILAAFENLETAPRLPGPKFVFAHIVAPHSPYLFDALGEPLSPSGPFTLVEDPVVASLSQSSQKYRGQAIFITSKVRELVEQILVRSKTPPVIILQADHGYGGDWDSMDSPGVSQRAAILNAYYLPYGCDRLLYPSITPINTFRVVFNCYYNASYPLLDDTVYYSYPPWVKGDGFIPINDRLLGDP